MKVLEFRGLKEEQQEKTKWRSLHLYLRGKGAIRGSGKVQLQSRYFQHTYSVQNILKERVEAEKPFGMFLHELVF